PDRRERVPELVGEDREELVLLPVGLAERALQALALGDLRLEAAVRALELGVRTLELARLLGLQRAVREGEIRVRGLERAVQLLELAALRVELREHGHL